MLDYWCEFKISTGIDSKANPENEIIVWNNRKILVGKKPAFYQNWFDAGITKISDIVNQNQDFLKWHELAIKFNLKVPFTTYYDPVNAIPKNWKACLKNPIPNVTHYTTVNTLRTSSIYSSLLNTIFVPPTAETKILRHGFTKHTIQKVYVMPFAVTNEVKIMFQFHNVLRNSNPCYTLSSRHFRKPDMQLMQRRRTNVASPANKLHTNSRFLDSVSRLVVPKNK